MTDHIGGWVTDNARRFPDKTVIQFDDGRSWTHAEFEDWVTALAGHLSHEESIAKGDRIAFLGYNHPAMIALLFACARIGAILVPLNWRLTPSELSFIVADCAPRLLIGDDEHMATAAEVIVGDDKCQLLHIDEITSPSPEEQAKAAGTLSDPLLIIYTSGTTGRPKGAVLSQRALLANAEGSIDMHAMTAGDRVLVVLPLFHVGGLNISLTPAIRVGATIELHARFDPAQVVAAIRKFRPHILVLVPATMMAVMKQPGWDTTDTGCLRMVTTGSMVVPVELITAWEDKGIPVVQVYGSTETCPVAAYTRPGDGRTNPHSTGKAGCRSQVRIVGPDGVAPPMVDGEIEVLGDHVMDGYWQRPGETAAAFDGEWFRTGDIGCLDEDGNLYFRERTRHMIVSGGENIYPAEIERVISAVPGVAEVAVCGIPHPRWGETPTAGIVRSDNTLSEEAIRRRLDEELARFKHPSRIVFLAELPRNAMGKVVHDDLRAILNDTR